MIRTHEELSAELWKCHELVGKDFGLYNIDRVCAFQVVVDGHRVPDTFSYYITARYGRRYFRQFAEVKLPIEESQLLKEYADNIREFRHDMSIIKEDAEQIPEKDDDSET